MQEGWLRSHHSNFYLWFISQEFFYSCLHGKFKCFQKTQKSAGLALCVVYPRSPLLQRLPHPLRSLCSDVFVKQPLGGLHLVSWPQPYLPFLLWVYFLFQSVAVTKKRDSSETLGYSSKSENPSPPAWQVMTCYGDVRHLARNSIICY